MKTIKRIASIVLIIVIVLFLYGNLAKIFSFPQIPLFNIFKKKVVRYDTKVILGKIKSIMEIYTQRFYTELLEDSGLIEVDGKKRRLVLIVKGEVTAGLDLETLDDDPEIDWETGSITLKLDSPFKVIPKTNPKDFEIFRRKGHWPPEEIKKWKVNAHERIKRRAIREKILDKCEKYGRYLIENFLKKIGFKEVKIEIIKNKEFVELEKELADEQKKIEEGLVGEQAKLMESFRLSAGEDKTRAEEMKQRMLEMKYQYLSDLHFKKNVEPRLIKVADVRITTDNEGKIIKADVLTPLENEYDKTWVNEQLDSIKETGSLGELPKSKTFKIELKKRTWEAKTG
jgi:hypothetical protein